MASGLADPCSRIRLSRSAARSRRRSGGFASLVEVAASPHLKDAVDAVLRVRANTMVMHLR